MQELDTVIRIFGLSLWALALGLTIWGTRRALRLFSSTPPHMDAPFNLFPVSIIKPMKGADGELEKNLESFFLLDYPDFELIFCAASGSDPACAVAHRLMARHPSVKARLSIGEIVVGPNPKVNNMLRGYESAAHDWTLVSDANVRVEPDYLRRMVAHLTPNVGLVTSVVMGCEACGWGGKIEAIYLNTFYARGMNLAAGFGRVCVVGKAMLFRRSVAKRFGGLRVLGRYLAEDYMAGEAMQRLGLEVVITCDPVRQVIGDYAFGAFWKRHLRWGRIRKQHGLLAFVLEPWLGALASGTFGALAAQASFGIPASHFILAHLALWSLCDLLILRSLKASVRWSTPVAWFLRELLALPLWVHIASGNKVEWRGHKLSLGRGGILET
jgi:ceramide glucosyltransferase